ncbi:TRAP transporter small permease [Pseudodonghicola flavimaris]|uniref:TRAP transporter small permease protein n=1 Tax=Pseudodonghicola flavimaris TaxID=3050036 RepID=A0ABT7F0P9_9RHOB|nr:TRAP transporter small permease subunit [Pseudodonghicola flavimaris]MDK3018186.1 TRAP transporter small permease subunit [Pseudodonghicola flavimaris]
MRIFARLFEALYALTRGVNTVAGIFAVICFGAMLLVVLLQVVARYVFAAPPFWTEELARWLMVWGGMIGATVAFHTHTDPSLVTPRPDSQARTAIRAVARAVAAWGFFLPVLLYSYPFVLRQVGRTSEGLGISTAFMSVALPVACVIICLHAVSGIGILFSARVRAREAATLTEIVTAEPA